MRIESEASAQPHGGYGAVVDRPGERIKDRQRVQLDFSPEAYQRLEQIRTLAGARTNAEVVRNSLRVYEWFLERTKRDTYKIQLVKDNAVKEVELIL